MPVKLMAPYNLDFKHDYFMVQVTFTGPLWLGNSLAVFVNGINVNWGTVKVTCTCFKPYYDLTPNLNGHDEKYRPTLRVGSLSADIVFNGHPTDDITMICGLTYPTVITVDKNKNIRASVLHKV
jgi:hypothetical protein